MQPGSNGGKDLLLVRRLAPERPSLRSDQMTHKGDNAANDVHEQGKDRSEETMISVGVTELLMLLVAVSAVGWLVYAVMRRQRR